MALQSIRPTTNLITDFLKISAGDMLNHYASYIGSSEKDVISNQLIMT
jgi:hypothetical protein